MRRRVVMGLALLVGAIVGWPGAATLAVSQPAFVAGRALLPAADPKPIVVSANGENGRGRIENPGLPCDQGEGAYWHTDQVAAMPTGGLSGAPGEVTFNLELHSGVITQPQSVDLPPPGLPGEPATAFLPPSQSQVVMSDQRGTVRLDLAGTGTCEEPTVLFDGRTATGEVGWTVGDATGSYAGAVGDGTIAFTTAVEPGADNPWSLDLTGDMAVPQPSLAAKVVGVFWGNLGTDYVTRRVSVIYELTNNGPGDAFNAVLASTSSPTAGVTPLGPNGITLGDLPAGVSRQVTVRYQLGLLNPCQLVLLGCKFKSAVNVAWTDALDLPLVASVGNLNSKAPDLPPLVVP